jgi:4-amino-4-deoxy-L-arabinose transferase-like glycosyltransferase
MKLKQYVQSRLLFLLLILTLSFAVRGLTAHFIHDHLSDPGWFQSGTYALFDKRAQEILDHRSSVFWIDDASRTESAIYPPGYPLWVALIYKLTGDRSAASVQRVQWLLDSLLVLLIVGIGVTAYNWHVGLAAGLLAAMSPLLALYGAVPLADSLTSWVVLAGVWLLLLATKRRTLKWAFAAGLMLGASCWLRANALLLPFFWAAVVLLVVRASWRERVALSGMVILGTVLLVTPLLVRNAVAFHIFTPTGLGVGTNLWEGIGETDRAAEFGAVYGDQALIEQERAALGVASDASFGLYFPDGVRRDRERTRKAFAVISAHPIWYSGVMLRRMAGVLKYAGAPAPFYGSAGINVTSKKCLPLNWQGGIMGLTVNLLGMIQSVLRYVALPLMVLGIWFGIKKDWRLACLLLSTVVYYLVVGSALHTEIRYGLPMQALLFVFAGVALVPSGSFGGYHQLQPRGLSAST